jgi:streptogramin lyase
VGTNSNGLLSFDPQTEEFSRLFQGTKTSEKLIGNSIYDIIKNKKGEIWILTDKGLNCVDNKTILKQYNIPSSIGRKAASKRRKKMAFDAKGNLWFIYKGVLLEHNPISSKITRINVGINNCSALECIASGSNNEMYVGSQKNGLITMNTISKKTMNIKWANYISSSDRLNHIISIHEDKLGTVWLGTGEIMIPINSSKLKWESVKPLTLPEYQFHIGNISSSIFEDQSGVIWSVANFNGLKKITIPTKFFSQYSATDEKGQASKNIKVNSFFQDKKGLIWLGTRKGMTAFDPTTKKIIPLSLSATDWVNLNEVSSFYDTKDESFLIGTWNRISAFSSLSLKTNKFRHYNLLNEKANTVGEITTLGSTLYIGTFGGGVRCLNKEDLKKRRLEQTTKYSLF